MVRKTERYKATIATRNLASFEFYMDFNDESIEEEIDRNGLAYFWTFGVTKEALGDGFNIMVMNNSKEEITPINEDFKELMNDTGFLKEFIQAVGIARAYGKAGILHFEDGSIKAFEPKNMDLEYDHKTRKFTGGILKEYVDYTDNVYYEHELNSSNIDFFYMMIFEEKSRTNRGRSALEPVWDYLQGLFICFFLSPLVVAQGTGMKVLKSPQFDVKGSADAKEDSLRPLRDMSYKLTLGIGERDEVNIFYPTNNTFISQTTEELFTALAAATGYPKEAWRGNQSGNLSGAEQTMTKMQTIHKTIQHAAYYYIVKSVKILAEIKKLPLPAGFKIKYQFGEDLTEEGQAALMYKKAQAITTLKEILTRDELRELFGYNPDGEDFLSQSMDKELDPNAFESRMQMDNEEPITTKPIKPIQES